MEHGTSVTSICSLSISELFRTNQWSSTDMNLDPFWYFRYNLGRVPHPDYYIEQGSHGVRSVCYLYYNFRYSM